MRSLPTDSMRVLALSVSSALVERPETNATPMLSQRVVTVAPTEFRSARPASGMEEVSLKTTTVFPVGIPLAGLSDVLTAAEDVGAAILVGSSVHAARSAAVGARITDHRRRLARSGIDFYPFCTDRLSIG